MATPIASNAASGSASNEQGNVTSALQEGASVVRETDPTQISRSNAADDAERADQVESTAPQNGSESSRILSTSDRVPIVHIDVSWDPATQQWKENPQDEQRDSKTNQQNCILLVRHTITPGIGMGIGIRDFKESVRETVTVEVKGESLRNVMEHLYRDANAFSWGKNHEIDSQWFYWAKQHLQDLKDYRPDQGDPPKYGAQEIDAALKFTTEFYAVHKSKQSHVEYDKLWKTFAPNTLVTGKDRLGHDRIWQVLHGRHQERQFSEEEEVFAVTVQFSDFNGATFGWAEDQIMIPKFPGAIPLQELEIKPLYLIHDRDERENIYQEILHRAEIQCDLSKSFRPTFPFRHYRGHGLVLDQSSNLGMRRATWMQREVAFVKEIMLRKKQFDGIVIVDPKKTLETTPEGLIPPVRKFPSNDTDEEPQLNTADGKVFSAKGFIERMTSTEDLRPSTQAQRSDPSEQELTNFQKVLLSGRVYGYSVASRDWGAFSVSVKMMKDVKWNSDAFEALVMEDNLKENLRRLVTAYFEQDLVVDDFIKKKGGGLVGLLHGDPGLGKTFTAEAIAGMAELPLFRISAGMLGSEATKIDKNLTDILSLASRWKAIVLLDEADVFLARRESGSFEHNAIVSIFLRELEYFPGIMILTTNREVDIDKAFESRIHFYHRYPDFTRNAREKLWKEFISKARRDGNISVLVHESEYEDLAALEYNGRQIKNILSIASLLAMEKDPKILTTKHIKSAASSFHDPDKHASNLRLFMQRMKLIPVSKGRSRFELASTGHKGATLLRPALYMITLLTLSVLAAHMLGGTKGSAWLRSYLFRGN